MQASLHLSLGVLEDGSSLGLGLADDSNQDNRQIFFAKVLRSATEDEVRQLFGQFGRVTDVNLFRAFQGAPTTKGCGLVTMGGHEEAVAAIAALDSQYVWGGMETPMVVKWMDTALQRRRREQHLANMRQAMAPGAGLGFGGLALATSLPVPSSIGMLQTSFMEALEPSETPPPGCASDAIKLFVGNVPKSCTEEQLLPLFQSIGKVVELVIVHDKVTHESKGSAFVWYANRNDAESAIVQFNFRHVLPDPSGDQDRPLVVRRAKARTKPQKHSPLLGGPAQGPSAHIAQQPFYKGLSGMMGLQSLDALQLGDAAGLGHAGLGHAGLGHAQAHASGVLGLGLGGMQGYRHMQGLGGQLMGAQQQQQQQVQAQQSAYGGYNSYSGDSLLSDYAVSQSYQHLDMLSSARQQTQHQQHHQQQQQQQVAQSMTLNQAQLAALNTHLFSVQTVSGAQLHISPGAPGIFNIIVSGSKSQVESAKGLITTVLSTGC
ncbi:CUGBP Elav-like family member 4 [Tetrabaena socialis]|uniref:CUGBP Elav-like family member 4 n=1 Tax=Tetrabaena socialis TaxID=47790 RepID=A0A2J8AIF4_9CHLO|nr:CUGBP Elav-like family member 4 [Tetrabaena socialis]|eukprot:PNH12299.1 CUGBP Elav-like family member 4 [Tetrabaena socialis]